MKLNNSNRALAVFGIAILFAVVAAAIMYLGVVLVVAFFT